jgi:hypothetical protein
MTRDMTEPVTRGEMYEALEIWAGAIIAKLTTRMDERFAEFGAEMRALVKTSETFMLTRLEALFDPHRAIPARVSALEEAALPERVSRIESRVFTPAATPRRRARAARPAKSRRRS